MPKHDPTAFEVTDCAASSHRRNPVIDVRAALFTIAGGDLFVACIGRGPARFLPHGNPNAGENLDAAARRLIHEACGLDGHYQEQLYTLSVTDGGGGWRVIVSYLALVCSGHTPAETGGVLWTALPSVEIAADADRMVLDYAMLRLRAKLGYTNIAFSLLPSQFTLTELQSAYETILGHPLDKRNFRRRMIASGIVVETSEKRRDGSHRPAVLYTFTAEHDPTTYLTPPWAKGT